MIKIKYRDGNTERVRHEVSISDKAIYRKELMAEEYVLLTFNTAELVDLRKGDYIYLNEPEMNWGRFEIVTIDKPKLQTGTNGGYAYEQKFHRAWERWRTRKLFYNRQRGAEKAWSMTQRPEYFMQIVCDNIRAAFGTDISAVIDPSLTEMKLLQFDGDDIITALGKIAEAWETEWWVEDTVIHLSKCEYGTPVGFEIGDLIRDMERSDGQENDYITRLYAFGSTRNIPTNYRKREDESEVVEGVVERRLMLPDGIDHIDAWPDLDDRDVVEGVAIFEEVYPRRVAEMSDITTTTYSEEVQEDGKDPYYEDWTAYRYKDNSIKFKEEYVLPDQELHIRFQSGKLAGMDFAVIFNPEGEDENSEAGQLWEVVRNDTYGVKLPNEAFHPEAGDTFVLYGFDTSLVSNSYIPAAEQELLIEARKLLAKKSIDKSVYTCHTDPISCAGYVMRKGELVSTGRTVDLDVGNAVELRDDNYFSESEGYRVSRVRAFEKRLDNPYNVTYEVGESGAYSKVNELDEKMEALTVKGETQLISLGSGVYLIKRYDGTEPSDHNAYSAKRANAEFLHRNTPDVSNGLIRFLAGLQVGYYKPLLEGGKFDAEGNLEANAAVIRNMAQIATAIVEQIGTDKFVDGFTGEGWQIWKAIATGDWNLTIDRLTVRKLMTVYELLIQKIRAVGGQIIVSAANGKVKDATLTEGRWKIVFEDDNMFAAGDLLRSAKFDRNGEALKGYWVEVADTFVEDYPDPEDPTKTIKWQGVYVDASQFENYTTPEVGDEVVLMGNTTNTARQNCISISATEDGQPRVDVLNGIHTTSTEGCLRARLGNLDGITDSYFGANQPKGDGLYADNAYLRGTFQLVNGEDVATKFKILEGKITSEITSVEKEMIGYESYLRNAYFNQDLVGWTTEDSGVVFYRIGNSWIWANGAPLSHKGDYAGISTEDGRKVLRIKNSSIVQANADFDKHLTASDFETFEDEDGKTYNLPRKFYLSFYYKVKKGGILKVGFHGIDRTGFRTFDNSWAKTTLTEKTMHYAGKPDMTDYTYGTGWSTNEEWKTFEAEFEWNGTGDFFIEFDGELCIYALRLGLDRVGDIEQRYKTLFEQTDRQIKLLAQEQNYTTTQLEQLQAGIIIEAGGIKTWVEKVLTDTEDGLTEAYKSYIEEQSESIRLGVMQSIGGSLKATGIDIETGKITFLANDIEFRNCEGEVGVLIDEKGYLDAKAIRTGTMTANQLIMYESEETEAQGKKAITITPQDKGMRVYRQDNGQICQEFTGELVEDGLARFFDQRASGSILVTQPSGADTTNARRLTVISNPWHSAKPTNVQFISGSIQAHAKTDYFKKTVKQTDYQPLSITATATVILYLRCYASHSSTTNACTGLKESIEIARVFASATSTNNRNANNPLNPMRAAGVDVPTPDNPISGSDVTIEFAQKEDFDSLQLRACAIKSTQGGWFRLELETSGSIPSVSAYPEISGLSEKSWGESCQAQSNCDRLPLVASYANDEYVSNFFANGFCLGTGRNSYILAYRQGENGMHFEAINGKFGIRMNASGLQKVSGLNEDGTPIWVDL